MPYVKRHIKHYLGGILRLESEALSDHFETRSKTTTGAANREGISTSGASSARA